MRSMYAEGVLLGVVRDDEGRGGDGFEWHGAERRESRRRGGERGGSGGG